MMKSTYRTVFILSLIFLAILNGIQAQSQEKKGGGQAKEDSLQTRQPIWKVALERSIDPKTYIVGPGDEFLISLVSLQSETFSTAISPTGDLFIPGVGAPHLDGMVLSEALDKIERVIKEQFRNSKVSVTLNNFRQFRINLVGFHPNPGMVTVTQLNRVSDVISSRETEGGLIFQGFLGELQTKEISNRNLYLIRDGDTIHVDLLSFYRLGNSEANPFFQEGDKLFVQIKHETVDLTGGVKLPGEYELVQGETLGEMIELAGGLTDDSDTSTIRITRFYGANEFEILEFDSFAEVKKERLHPDDQIAISILKDYHESKRVYVTGEIKHPGTYTLPEDTVWSIRDLINVAGGFTADADSLQLIVQNRALLERSDPEIERLEEIPRIDMYIEEEGYLKARNRTPFGQKSILLIEENFNEQLEAFILQDNDIVDIPTIYSGVEVLGAVNEPGVVEYNPDKTVGEYITEVGGENWESSGTYFVIRFGTNQWEEIGEDYVPANRDKVFIQPKKRIDPWERFTEIMAVAGQVATVLLLFTRF